MSITAKKNKMIKKDILPSGPINHRDVKVRITTMIDGDLLLAIRAEAEKRGERYQTLINQVLRQRFLDDKSKIFEEALEQRMREIAREEVLKKAV